MKSKLAAGVITVAILTLLILSGPANAFVLSITAASGTVEVGGTLTFTISAASEQNDTSPGLFTLDLLGVSNVTCKFDINGTVLQGCAGAKITRVSEEFGYGYGYGYNVLKNVEFKIDINTSNMNSGRYTPVITVTNDGRTNSKQGAAVTLTPSRQGLIDCSIRGEGGSLTVESKNLGANNKINFFVPLKNAALGTGYLTGQKGKDRINYNFKVMKVLNNNKNETRILVSGSYTLGIRKGVKTDAVILITKPGKVSLSGINISLDNMKITFIKGC